MCVGVPASGSRIQPPSSQPGSYRLRSRQPNPEPAQQQQPISVKKPVSQAPLPATPAVSSVSHPPPPSSAHQNNIEEKEREKQIVSSTDSSVKDKPSAGEPTLYVNSIGTYYMRVHCTYMYSSVWVILFRQFNINIFACNLPCRLAYSCIHVYGIHVHCILAMLYYILVDVYIV